MTRSAVHRLTRVELSLVQAACAEDLAWLMLGFLLESELNQIPLESPNLSLQSPNLVRLLGSTQLLLWPELLSPKSYLVGELMEEKASNGTEKLESPSAISWLHLGH